MTGVSVVVVMPGGAMYAALGAILSGRQNYVPSGLIDEDTGFVLTDESNGQTVTAEVAT